MHVTVAGPSERQEIYRLRHAVYARELGQHPENDRGERTDALDDRNVYLVARDDAGVAGFVSVTPPGRYSIDKYLSRAELPFACDDSLYEVRLLTIPEERRGGTLAALLMYSALRWIDARGGTRIVAIGREEILPLYERVGLRRLGRRIQSGAVTYELMSATVAELQDRARKFPTLLERLDRIGWRAEEACFHGGRFFDAIGPEFDELDRRREIINADVLDAWFPPAPRVVRAVRRQLPWLMQTSPPTQSEGLVRVIARSRRVPEESVVAGGGSSDLIFQAFPRWLTKSSRVLILDPMYGEYAHVLERVIECRVDRVELDRRNGYALDPVRLLDGDYDLVVVVNPNNPTGRHAALLPVLRRIRARVWVDEAYIDYVDPAASLERFAAASPNVVVCKSMSKAYALSGMRAAYLVAPPAIARELRRHSPPWAVSLPAQVAAVEALQSPRYYARRWRETASLRRSLAEQLAPLGEVMPAELNFVLIHLEDGPDAAEVVEACRREGLFVRDMAATSARMGRRALRVAVKDEATNQRIAEIMRAACRPTS